MILISKKSTCSLYYNILLSNKLYNFRFQNVFEIYSHMAGEKKDKYAQAENDITTLVKSIEEELK